MGPSTGCSPPVSLDGCGRDEPVGFQTAQVPSAELSLRAAILHIVAGGLPQHEPHEPAGQVIL